MFLVNRSVEANIVTRDVILSFNPLDRMAKESSFLSPQEMQMVINNCHVNLLEILDDQYINC